MWRTGFYNHCICQTEGRSWTDLSGRSNWSSFGQLSLGLNQRLSVEMTEKARRSSSRSCRLRGDFTAQVGWMQRAHNCQNRPKEWETNSNRFSGGLFCLCFSIGSDQGPEEIQLCTCCLISEDIWKSSLHPEASTLFSSFLHYWRQNIWKLLSYPHFTLDWEHISVSGILQLT